MRNILIAIIEIFFSLPRRKWGGGKIAFSPQSQLRAFRQSVDSIISGSASGTASFLRSRVA
jgi:hypothetical protein